MILLKTILLMNFKTLGAASFSAPPLGFRFGVVFLLMGAIPNPIDFRFQSVSGIGMTLTTQPVEEDAFSNERTFLPKKTTYSNLVLERGVLLGSPLTIAIEEAFDLMQFVPIDVLVSVFNESMVPIKVWKFHKAFPVKWSISGIDANSSNVLMESIELKYRSFSRMAL